MKKLLFGIAISAVFIYFSVRGLDPAKIFDGLKNANYIYLLPAFFLMLLISFLRSLRWGIILSPIAKIEQRVLYPLTCIGFMAIIVVPMRAGEFIRPYLLKAKNLAPYSSALATVFIERVFDIFTVLGIFFFVVSSSSALPPWLVKAGYSAIAVFILMTAFMCLLYFRRDFTLRLVSPLIRPLPERFHKAIYSLIHNFLDGFEIIASPRRLFGSLALSALIWGASGLSIYSLFFFLGLKFPLVAAFIVLFVTIIGITLPAAPGMLGNFQFACIMGLSLFGLPKDEAFIFSMVYYFLGIGTVILLGLIFLPFVKISFIDTIKEIKEGLNGSVQSKANLDGKTS